jgi:putative ABC transport system permease protein
MEFRFAIRRLRHRAAASIGSVATLGCAIGAVTAAWSLLGTVFFHPLDVREPSALRVVANLAAGMPAESVGVSYPEMIVIRDARVFDQVTAYGVITAETRIGSERQTLTIDCVTADFFDVLGVSPSPGRGFELSEDRRGVPPVAVVSDRFWRENLGGDPAVIGQMLPIGQTSARIVGVAPAAFRGLSISHRPAVFIPISSVEQVAPRGMNYFAEPMRGFSPAAWVHVVGRLKAGESDQSGAVQLSTALHKAPTEALQLLSADVAALPADSRPDMATLARLLGMTTGLLLVIGSLTVGTLLLVRTEARRGEFGVRLALGATRTRLAAGVALEGVILTSIGCALAWPVAAFLLQAVRAFELPGHLVIGELAVSLDQSALTAAILAALFTAAAITALAAFVSLRASVEDVRHARAGATPRVRRRNARLTLVIAQVAVATVLLGGTGLFARSLMAALTLNPSIDAAHTVSTSMNLTNRHWPQERSEAYFADLLEKLRQLPSIDAIGSTMDAISMSSSGALTIDGTPIKLGRRVDYLAVDPGYLPALGLHVISGRNFSDRDDARAPRVALVSASLAKRLADAHGRVLGRHFDEALAGRADEIVGVVPDVITEVRRTEPLLVYQPIGQQPHLPIRHLLIRAANPAAAIRDTRATLLAFDSTFVPWSVETINQQLLTQMAPQRFGMTIFGGLGAIAALLTLLGTYVLAESMASGRRREMGIRAALGASRIQLGRIVLAETATLVGAGLAAGLGLAWLGAGTIRALLFRTAPLDPATLTVVAACILVMALAVSLGPAFRAARPDLIESLREE